MGVLVVPFDSSRHMHVTSLSNFCYGLEKTFFNDEALMLGNWLRSIFNSHESCRLYELE